MSLAIFVLRVGSLVYYTPGHSLTGPAIAPLYAFAVLMIFYWIDSTGLAARRSDPLLRNTLIWGRLRYLFWGGNVSFLLLFISFAVYFFGPQGLVTPGTGRTIPPALVVIIPVPLLLTGLAGLLLLPLAARRSGDANLRKSLRWFAAFAAALLAALLVLVLIIAGPLKNVEYVGQTFLGICFLIAGLFLQRSAKALVPLNKLPKYS